MFYTGVKKNEMSLRRGDILYIPMERASKKRTGVSIAEGIFVVVVIGSAYFFGTNFNHQAASTMVEAKFADSSHSGLSIVPASCPSDPHDTETASCTCPRYHTVTNSGLGWVITGDGQLNMITRTGGAAVCISNSTGKALFVPALTLGEYNSFIASIPSIPGLYQIAPDFSVYGGGTGYGGGTSQGGGSN
jgi:hypothetical protein